MEIPLPHIFDFIPFVLDNLMWVALGVVIILAVSAIDWAYHKVKDRLTRGGAEGEHAPRP